MAVRIYADFYVNGALQVRELPVTPQSKEQLKDWAKRMNHTLTLVFSYGVCVITPRNETMVVYYPSGDIEDIYKGEWMTPDFPYDDSWLVMGKQGR